jgi:hypothetical protein
MAALKGARNLRHEAVIEVQREAERLGLFD